MFKISLSSSPILEVSETGFVSSPMDDVLPRESRDCTDLASALAALDEYASRATATGKPGHAFVHFPRQQARKPRGFDKADRERKFNLEMLGAKA